MDISPSLAVKTVMDWRRSAARVATVPADISLAATLVTVWADGHVVAVTGAGNGNTGGHAMLATGMDISNANLVADEGIVIMSARLVAGMET